MGGEVTGCPVAEAIGTVLPRAFTTKAFVGWDSYSIVCWAQEVEEQCRAFRDEVAKDFHVVGHTLGDDTRGTRHPKDLFNKGVQIGDLCLDHVLKRWLLMICQSIRVRLV